jgi:hypothetical protein
MAKYSVKSNLRYGGVDYKEGSIVDLPEEAAKHLIGIGVVGQALTKDQEENAGNKKKKSE